MHFSIASFSFHRLLWGGQQDMFKYIDDSKALGMVQLDPWNGHLDVIKADDEAIKAGDDPERLSFSPDTQAYVARVRAHADAAGLPFGCLAVDGAHIYEDDPDKRRRNRFSAYRWLNVAEQLGAKQVRIDCGGTEEMPEAMLAVIVDGYRDLIPRAKAKGIDLVIENHWGPSVRPANLVKLFAAVPELGLLMDSNNWAEGHQHEGWEVGAPYTKSIHVKTFSFDDDGNEPSVDLRTFYRLMVGAGYHGVWGIESVPKDGDEYGAITKTVALLERIASEAQA